MYVCSALCRCPPEQLLVPTSEADRLGRLGWLAVTGGSISPKAEKLSLARVVLVSIQDIFVCPYLNFPYEYIVNSIS